MGELASSKLLSIKLRQVNLVYHLTHAISYFKIVATPAVEVADLLKETNKDSLTPLHVATEVPRVYSTKMPLFTFSVVMAIL